MVNPNPETYEEMASRVNHFTLATPKKVDILETTKNILDFCENKGFSKADLGRTLRSFVEHHIKHMMALLSIKSENLEILEIISNSVSYTEAKKAVKENQFKEVAHGRTVPITLECAEKLKDAGIIPLGCAVQWTIDELGNPKVKRRTTHKIGFWSRNGSGTGRFK